ncbi:MULTISPECIES: helix-turn-helix transcriptional regulator [unclassified Streptomyces]|uniref:helix-turn-helix domain-containing protein n=1 Tax=unclassified Streptomyces TaxID=2593676 RepID=UPI001BE90F96|nr:MULTISPECIES: helix-turn-helix transcriptional regulator [unclassified Streptomyces]MBT2402136.1 helix-turn-helix domain-containing protein [Streptomyces sp. ISL-21]MBT2453602.1 helix-turn-helix domain-containing protein [Streptomyces sp. ISL-86]MBT2609322.1 helix-turn-helix domain-containing protein [Streptomyces sp. ISL-87]
MGVTVNPTVSRRRLGAELRRLREVSGMTTQQVAARLLISQPKISLLENGRRPIKPRDVRDLCELYGVRDQRRVDHLLQMARESGQQGWWNAYDDIPYGAYIGLEAEAAAIRFYEPLVVPGLLQTPAYARAVIAGTIPHATAEQAATRLQVRMRRQDRLRAPGNPLRLWAVLDESALWRVVGSREVMRKQLDHLTRLSAQPHITMQVLPHDVGAHPGVSGQFSLLEFADTTDVSVVYLERFTSDLYLEKRSDVRRYSDMYAHLQAKALSPDGTRHFIEEAIRAYAGPEPWPDARALSLPSP